MLLDSNFPIKNYEVPVYTSKINYLQLVVALKRIQTIHAKTKNKRKEYLLELYFKPNKLEVGAIGITITVECKTSYYKKLIVPFLPFQQLIYALDKEWIEIEFDDSYVQLNKRRIESNFIKVEHPENQRKPNLSINYSKLELLSLRNKYLDSELKSNNLLIPLEKAESELDENINTSVSALKSYGVTYTEIKNLINKKIAAVLKIDKN